MACSCRHRKGSDIAVNDPETEKAYGSAFENERNILYHPDYDDEQENIADEVLSTNENISNISRDMIFVDGNDQDLEVCEYEDTLMERVWRSSKPPKIPKQICEVPARRIQITKERLSPTIKGIPSLRDAFTTSEKKHLNKRHKIKSNVKYIPVNNFNEDKHFSCQSKTVTVVPNCARMLQELL